MVWTKKIQKRQSCWLVAAWVVDISKENLLITQCWSQELFKMCIAGLNARGQRRRHCWLTAAAQWRSHTTAATSTANIVMNRTKFMNFRQKVIYSNFPNLSNFYYEFLSITVLFFTGRQRSCKPCTSYRRQAVCLSVRLSVCHTLALSENDAS